MVEAVLSMKKLRHGEVISSGHVVNKKRARCAAETLRFQGMEVACWRNGVLAFPACP